jgi:hypothetical protein
VTASPDAAVLPDTPRAAGTARGRRHRRQAEQAALVGVAVATAVGAAVSGAAPTGWPVADAVWSAAFAVLVALAATRANRWTWVVLAGVATVAAGSGAAAVAGGAALALTLVAALADVRGPVIGALVGGLSVQALLRLGDFGLPRLSALLVVVAVAPLLWSAYHLSRRATRRWARRGALAAGVVVVVAGLGALAAFVEARTSADLGSTQVERGLTAVREGDTAGALAELDAATASFREARSRAGSPLTLPARAVPGMAAQVRAVDVAADVGAEVTATAAETLRGADYRAVRAEGGRIDVARLAAMAAPLDDAAAELRAGGSEVAAIDDTWLLPPVAAERDRLQRRIANVQPSTELAAEATAVLPGLLGAQRPHRYLVLFAQPAESRLLGGFVGGYAELVADGGSVDLVRSGPIEELSEADGRNDRTITSSPSFVSRYGRFRPERYLQNVTAAPDLPTVRTVLQELYPQAGGAPIDGVIYVDPAGLSALLELTGPVKVPGLDRQLTANNVEEYLLREQYRAFDDDDVRDEVLTAAGRATFDALLDEELPGPERLGKALGPAVRGGHLAVSVADPHGERFLSRLGADGALGVPVGQDWLSVRGYNGNGNKIDAHLERAVRYEATYDPDTGQVTATITVELTNRAPATGEPRAVIGNANGDPEGTNRMYLSVYTPLGLDAATLDGRPLAVEPQEELGSRVWSAPVVLGPGQRATVELRLAGTVAAGSTYRLTVLPQPLPEPDQLSVTVRSAGGRWALATVDGARREGDAAVWDGTAEEPVVVEATFEQR